jgi:hypothetical protein
VILRIVTGHLEPGMDQADLADLQDQLARMARGVAGLDSLILGLRPTDADPRPESALVTVWRDAEAMVRATSADEQDRFLGTRLRLALDLRAADHYEIIGRTFAALPPAGRPSCGSSGVLSRPNEEQALMDTLREQQPRLVELGLVASHIGRRVVGRDVEGRVRRRLAGSRVDPAAMTAVRTRRCSLTSSRPGRIGCGSTRTTASRSPRGCPRRAARRCSSSTTTCASWT